MYAPHKSAKTQIEDMLESPLSLLGLIKHFNGKYHFSLSPKNTPIEVIAHNINNKFRDSKTISIKTTLSKLACKKLRTENTNFATDIGKPLKGL